MSVFSQASKVPGTGAIDTYNTPDPRPNKLRETFPPLGAPGCKALEHQSAPLWHAAPQPKAKAK